MFKELCYPKIWYPHINMLFIGFLVFIEQCRCPDRDFSVYAYTLLKQLFCGYNHITKQTILLQVNNFWMILSPILKFIQYEPWGQCRRLLLLHFSDKVNSVIIDKCSVMCLRVECVGQISKFHQILTSNYCSFRDQQIQCTI